MKHLPILLSLLLQAINSFANMASPLRPGSRPAAALSSRNIDILQETIRIEIGEDFTRASYQIEYRIQSPGECRIPLLFVAKDLSDSFRVWLDGRPQSLLPVPEKYNSTIPQSFDGFEGTLRQERHPINTTVIEWGPYESLTCRPDELCYFETALSKGAHRISVRYEGRAWEDVSDWMTEYSHRYSLSPAKYWRSFGGLDIVLKTTLPKAVQLHTNLGAPASRDSVLRWHFTRLPEAYMLISLQPQLTGAVKPLTHWGPAGLMGTAALILVLLHLFTIFFFRKRYPRWKYSWVLILGSFLVPWLILASYVAAFPLIDGLIGPHASRYHGYTFLIYILYPLLLPVYFLLLWLADRRFTSRMLRSNTNVHP